LSNVFILYLDYLNMKKKKSRSDDAGGMIFVGALMIGIGVGIFFGNPAVGTLVGLGIGFIFFGLVKAFMKK
jgi:hypothetical protein